MNEVVKNMDWSSLSYEDKNELLFFQQKRTLDLFLERGAISREQHDKSLHDLVEKTGRLVGNGSDLKQV